MTFQRHASFACLVVFAEAIAATLGEERCRAGEGRSCIDPSSRVLPMDATGSMLQVKASQSEEMTGQEGLHHKQLPKEVQNMLNGAREALTQKVAAGMAYATELTKGAENKVEQTIAAGTAYATELENGAEKEAKQTVAAGMEYVTELQNTIVNIEKGAEKEAENAVEEEIEKVETTEHEYENKAKETLGEIVSTEVKAKKGVVDLEDEVKKEVVELEEDIPAEIEKALTEGEHVVDEEVIEVEKEGLQEVKAAAAIAGEKIDAVANNVEDGFVAAGNTISTEEKAVEQFMEEEAPQAKLTIAAAEKVIESKLADAVSPNKKINGEVESALTRTIHPYAVIAEASIDAEASEVSGVMAAVKHETLSLGDEARGVAHTAKDAAHEGFKTAAGDIAD